MENVKKDPAPQFINAVEVVNAEIKNAKVISSNIAEIGYNSESQVMEVVFNNGNKYRYAKVPKDIFDGFGKAESLGAFLAANIKGKYLAFRIEK